MDRSGHTRKAIRFPLEIRVVFWWTEGGIELRSEGRTRDISEMGVFVRASICPPPGALIGFSVLLPVIPGFERQTRVEAEGQVQRVEQAGGRPGRSGFAILTQHTLLRINSEIRESRANAASIGG